MGQRPHSTDNATKLVVGFASCLGLLGPAVVYGERIVLGRDGWAYEGWEWVLYTIGLGLWPTFVLLLGLTQESEWSFRAGAAVALSIAANVALWGGIGMVVWKVVAAAKGLRKPPESS